MSPTPGHPYVLDLKAGELVRVRSAKEIFATLDGRGTLDSLPFMPEMVRYCGQTLPVFKRADKTCDSHYTKRRMQNAVHLAPIRCDGSAHDGCQARCLMFWKEAWLERVDPAGGAPRLRPLEPDEQRFIERTLVAQTRSGDPANGEPLRYRCQATEVERAAVRLRGWQVSQYGRDMRAWGARKVIVGLIIAVFNKLQDLNRQHLPNMLIIHRGQRYPFIEGQLDGEQAPPAGLGLQPGEMVRIKSREEILATLDRTNHNRGLSFDVEMLKYCGRTARVLSRVERLIDEVEGTMLRIKSDCIILEGVVCTADYHRFCTKSTYPYWREAWLERID